MFESDKQLTKFLQANEEATEAVIASGTIAKLVAAAEEQPPALPPSATMEE